MVRALMLALGLLATATAACSRSGDDSLPARLHPAEGSAEVSLTGAGATFPYPLYTKWISEYQKAKEGVRINFQSIGSGGGIRQIAERTVDFGASDAPMTDEQIATIPGIVHIPTCLGAVVLAYDLEGIPSGLRITPEAAAGIFVGSVKTWDDPLLQRENPTTPLPRRPIVAVHRSDGSGTTRAFTEWLAAGSPAWRDGPGVGMSVAFPSGLGAKGNEGVAGQIAGTPGAIGYVELAYAVQNHLPYAAVRGAAGAFVLPTASSIAAAGAAAAAAMPGDLRGSAAFAGRPDAYPITSFTYVLLHRQQTDAARGRALVDFLAWTVHEGQRFTEALSYAPLPPSLVARVDAKLASIVGPDDRPLRPAAD